MKKGNRARRSRSALRSLLAVILAIATTATLTACVDGVQIPAPTSTPSSGSETTEEDNHAEDPHDHGEVTPAPEAAGDSQAGALDVATLTLQTFARPELDYNTWWAELLPLLTEQAGVAYEGTNPAEIPVHQVTGVGVVLAGSTEVSLIVQLPTDVGPYNITLTRPSTDALWLADRIRPAQG